MNETDGQKNIYIQTQCVESPDAESGNMQSIDTGMSDEVKEDMYTQDDIKYMKAGKESMEADRGADWLCDCI